MPLSVFVPEDSLPNGRRQEWKCHEERILVEHYPKGGVRACIERMPGRTVNAIRIRARNLGLVAPKYRPTNSPRRALPSNERIDEEIRIAYCSGETGYLLRVARKIGRSESWAKARAIELGINIPQRMVPWSKTEDELLHVMAEEGLGLETMRKRFEDQSFKRTILAIKSRLFRLGLEMPDPADTEWYSVSQLAALFGVRWSTIKKWIDQKKLPADKTAREWRVDRRNLRLWIKNNVALIRMPALDKFWFVDLLTD